MDSSLEDIHHSLAGTHDQSRSRSWEMGHHQRLLDLRIPTDLGKTPGSIQGQGQTNPGYNLHTNETLSQA